MNKRQKRFYEQVWMQAYPKKMAKILGEIDAQIHNQTKAPPFRLPMNIAFDLYLDQFSRIPNIIAFQLDTEFKNDKA